MTSTVLTRHSSAEEIATQSANVVAEHLTMEDIEVRLEEMRAKKAHLEGLSPTFKIDKELDILKVHIRVFEDVKGSRLRRGVDAGI